VEQCVLLERQVEVALGVEDRDSDVAAHREEGLELIGCPDGDRREAGGSELVGDGPALGGRKSDDDRWSCHDLLTPGFRW